MPPHRVVHVAVERCLELVCPSARGPSGTRSCENLGRPDWLHSGHSRLHATCLVYPVQAAQRDAKSTPSVTGKSVSSVAN